MLTHQELLQAYTEDHIALIQESYLIGETYEVLKTRVEKYARENSLKVPTIAWLFFLSGGKEGNDKSI